MEVDNVMATKTSKDLIERITLESAIEKKSKIIFSDTVELIDYIFQE